MNDHVYLFTDASFKGANCHTNRHKKNMASVSFIFNKDRKKQSDTHIIENIETSNEAELIAIRSGIKSVIASYKKEAKKPKIKVFTDSLTSVKYLNDDLSPKKRKRKSMAKFRCIVNEIKFLAASCKHDVEFIHVKGHMKSP